MLGYDRIKALAQAYHFDVSLRAASDFDFEGANPLVELMSMFQTTYMQATL